MPQKRLTKQEALNLITSVIDEEVDEGTRIAFFRYIKTDPYVRQQYESAHRVKELMATRCPVAKAPDHLRRRIYVILAAERAAYSDSALEEPVYDVPCKETPFSYSGETGPKEQVSATDNQHLYQQNWFYVSATVFFITLLFWSIVLVTQSASPSYSLEEYAYRHFTNHKGSFIQPTISTASMNFAETALAANFNLPITIPPLTNAEFKGVVLTDFVPNYKAPLLEYYLPDEGQYIYIFAFDIGKLDEYGTLNRNEEAVNTCLKPEDFHIRAINGKHVVSWKWNNTWYAAISNHDGQKLASMVQPLQYEPGNDDKKP